MRAYRGKSFVLWFLVSMVVVAALVAFGGYYLTRRSGPGPSSAPAVSSRPAES